ncbi:MULTISPECIES: acetolactate synthase 2 catalytic subunit [unclassified Moritella]|uniref:acetolactate synthase 2 catalytic subunit n=1 Tax=unclassified Moritella TaxID=2637987 RepID=UPI001BA7941D|nr:MULTISPECIES: acetolactate synthase 2 catalytic subunit [unclassified Moritella]QUM83073.1 acetolactate synthase 2 catalytic subunit [Moritella sp. 28]QUM87374.1 acetolactate synthase 2 catalytic subunit [Moritella sp. 36]
MKATEFIVNALRKQGVNQVFGYPGGAIMPLYDALYDGGVAHLLARHEQGAIMAALGYARAGARVGVCIATSGPGATNLVTGLAEAMADSIPVVAFTGQVPSALIGVDTFQEVDILGMTLSCTKHSFLVEDQNDLDRIIAEAFTIATTGRPGPVLIDIPKDIQLAEMACETVSELPVLPPLDGLVDEEVTAARALLHAAKKPVLYVGGGVGMANAVPELRELAAALDIPMVSTLKGIGSADPEHPYYLGMLGMHGLKAANLAVQESDLLIAVGARFDDRVTGKLDEFAPNAKVIHLDIDACEHNKLRVANVAITTDLKLILPALKMTLDIAPWRLHTLEMKVDTAFRYDHPGIAIYAPLLLKQLSASLPEDHLVACDVGQHQMWTAQHMTFTQPENLLSSAGFGTMGFGLPAAVGAALARPDAMPVVVTGDGSIMMNIQELATINRAKLPVKIVLIDNQRLGMVRQWQTLFFDGRLSQTILDDNPDFVALAAACGIPGETVVVKEQVQPAMERMLASDGAYFLHVQISEQENVWPLVPPGVNNGDMLEQYDEC